MTSRSSSFSAHYQLPSSLTERRLSRRLSNLPSLEEGQHGASTAPAEHAITEEIAEIKRYEDFTTIDWVQDAAREQLRRKARRRRNAGLYDNGQLGWKHRLWESYDAAQGWIVVTLIGAAIGLNAAFLNIVTEWLSDIK